MDDFLVGLFIVFGSKNKAKQARREYIFKFKISSFAYSYSIFLSLV